MEAPSRHRTPWTEDDLATASELMRQGRSNREIAVELGRTESTTNVMFYRLGLNRGTTHCLNCKAELEQPAVGRKRQYCNETCRQSRERHQQRLDREARFDPERRCGYCGAPVTLDRQRRGSALVLYCSRSCSQDAWYERKCAAEGRVPVKTRRRAQ